MNIFKDATNLNFITPNYLTSSVYIPRCSFEKPYLDYIFYLLQDKLKIKFNNIGTKKMK